MSYCVDLGTWTYGNALPAVLPKKPTLAQIKRVQDVIAEMPQIEAEPEHYFAPGMYVRKLALPAGAVVVGKMHRHEHIVMLTKGETTIRTDEGMQRFVAPHIWTSSAGMKRVLYTHTDCEFVTVHATNETDVEALEAELIIPEAQIEYDAAPFVKELQEMYA